jgi:hypothetical protein
MMKHVWPLPFAGFVLGLWVAAWINAAWPFSTLFIATVLCIPAIIATVAWRDRNWKRKPVGYTFELRYSEGRWSQQRMFSERLPSARDYRNAIPLYAD